MQSKATTVEQYLAELPEDRREAINALRKVILQNLDKNYQEVMNYGMIGYVVPHSVYPPGYHCNPKLPLPFAGLASQKGAISLYLCSLYSDCDGGKGSEYTEWFKKAWTGAGKKLDMGKCCIRFKKIDDVPLDVVGEAFKRVPAKAFIAMTEAALEAMRNGPRKPAKFAKTKASAPKAGTRNAAPKKAASVKPKKKARKKPTLKSASR
jgi:hypothetical protein